VQPHVYSTSGPTDYVNIFAGVDNLSTETKPPSYIEVESGKNLYPTWRDSPDPAGERSSHLSRYQENKPPDYTISDKGPDYFITETKKAHILLETGDIYVVQTKSDPYVSAY